MEGSETWLLESGCLEQLVLLVRLARNLAGQYQEELAEFATGNDTVIPSSGTELSFQSAHSGCTGNGSSCLI